MKRTQLVSSGSLDRMLKAAKDSWERKDFQQCIEVLERASRLAPGNSAILLDLGRCYGLRYDYAAAERCFEKAIRLVPKKAQILTTVARSSIDFASHKMAESYFERALDQKDAAPETFAYSAELYERFSRLEDASALVDRALELDSTCAVALLVRARLERRAGRFEEAEKVVRALLNKPDPGVQPGPERDTRARAWYELGAILDRLRRYDEAMAAFLRAKALLRPDAAPLLARIESDRALIRERQAAISAGILQRWFDSGPALAPFRRLAFLGGHPRSGTTLLEQVLDSHPDIVSAEETDVFVNDAFLPLRTASNENTSMLTILESAQTGALQQSRANYFRLMEQHLGKVIGDRLLLDKNPSMTLFIPAFLRVFPETRILVALRDPRDVCLSCFMQVYVPITMGSAGYLSLGNTVESYTTMMSSWRRLAPLIKNPCLEVRYEDTVDDLESVCRRVLDFLGVPWNEDVLRFDQHARQKRVRSPSYADVTKPVFKTAVGRWRNYQKYLEPHLAALEPLAKAFGYE